ncbi:MAG: ferritin [Bacteroidales bacterium]|jgi:ferritin|nr:ferritin [Bacteroidales bacterium]
MIKVSVSKVLSEQINAEYYSAYLYLTMSAYADRAGFKGIANWLFVQSQEEMAHGTHIYQHLLERGEMPSFAEIKLPPITFDSIKAVFEQVLAHEQHVTSLLDNIATIAMSEKDHATYNFILWYVNEQIEEEATADELLNKIKMIGDNTALLFNLDAELATRVFNDPFATQA